MDIKHVAGMVIIIALIVGAIKAERESGLRAGLGLAVFFAVLGFMDSLS